MTANRKLDHATAREWMTEHIDQVLDSTRTETLMAYLQRHPDLEEEFAELAATVKLVGELDVVDPPANFAASVITQLPSKKNKSFVIPFSNPVVQLLAAAAMLAIVVRFGFEMKRPERVAPTRVAQDQLAKRKDIAKLASAQAEDSETADHVQGEAYKVTEPIVQEVLEEREAADPDGVAPTLRSEPAPAPAPALRQAVSDSAPLAEPEGRIWTGRSRGVSRADDIVASDYDDAQSAGAGTRVQRALEAPEEMAQPSRSLAAAQVPADASATGAKDSEVAFGKARALGGSGDSVDELDSPSPRTADMRERPDLGGEGIAKSEEYSRRASAKPVTVQESAAQPAAEATLSTVAGWADDVRRIGVTIDRKREPELRALLARYDTGRNDKEAKEKTGRRAEKESTSRLAVRHGQLPQLVEALRKIGQVHTAPARGSVGNALAETKALDRDSGAVVIVQLEIQYSDATDPVPRSPGD
ncbi:MAG: hypothetical protein O2923_12790 [Verrucomicrobia bacterium]|nr:hypothetical protein [Verrucomicrobiota bacterium]MDA1088374.1 hypothetical protein [Verrucomicrobiota bacterium]